MIMQAYIGPNQPRTLAEGQAPEGTKYAVLRRNRSTGQITWFGGYLSYGSAVAARQRITTDYNEGILAMARRKPSEDEVERMRRRALDREQSRPVNRLRPDLYDLIRNKEQGK